MRHKSVVLGKDFECIKILLEVHSSCENPKILDCTYNKGVMWKGLDLKVTTLDINPEYKTDYVGDFRNMWFFGESSFDVIVFDPPHLPTNAASNNSSLIYKDRYGITSDKERGRDGDNISEMFFPFLKEAKRILRENGIVLAKLCDIIHNHKYQWQMLDFVSAVKEVGMTPCDLLIKVDPNAGKLTSSKWKRVKHLRKSHSYWIVVRKGGCEKWTNMQA